MKAPVLLFVASLVCAPLVYAPLPGVADALPDSQTIRDRSSAAYGPLPDAFHQEIEYTGTAANGKEVIFKRGPDRREVDDAGPLHTEFGTNAGQHWHENENGHVVIDQSDPGLATRESFTTTVTHVTDPIDAYVISVLNTKGFGSREFFDLKTWYVVKRETLTPTGKITTTYDDFKPFGARHLAGHWHVNNETTGAQADYTNREYVAGDVNDADVAIPEMKSALVEYPAGISRVVLPAVFEPSGHVVVRLTINDRGYDFLLDTGASNIVIDPAIAHQLGLTVIDKMSSSANAGRVATGVAVVPTIGIGSLTMHNAVLQIAPWAAEEPGVKSVGLLGFDFLCESGITIDYDHQQVIAEKYGSYSAPQGPHVIALQARLGHQIPMTTADINGAVAERIMLDTGAVGPFLLFDYFERRHPEALRSNAYERDVAFGGMGGRFDAKTVELATFTLGNVAFRNFTGYRVTSGSSYSFDADGVIGPDFLHYFDVHLDYPNGMIYLVPNATGQKSMH